jgi:hypothetical protein
MSIRRLLVLSVALSLWPVAGSVAQQSNVSDAPRTVSVMPPHTSQPILEAALATAPADLSVSKQTVVAAAKAVTSDARFGLGWDQRWRNEEWNNLADYKDSKDDERSQNALRQRFWAQAPLYKESVLYVRILNQVTKQTKNGSLTPAQLKLNSDEWIFDNLYLVFKKLPVKNLALTVGRQDLMFGEGFLVLDGSAGDGPRTNYVNAFDFTYTHRKSHWDLVGILDPRQDRILPKLHNQHKYLNEWNEQAIALYYTNREVKGFNWDAYYILKKETNDYRAATNAQFQPDRHIDTLGARAVKQFPQGLTVTGEFAYQWGAQHANIVLARPAEDIRAWGGFVYAKKQVAQKYKPYFLAGYWALSGDDGKTTGTNEGFDPLFSRWPKWSGGYVFSLTPEKGTGYWTNLKMPQAEVGFTPVKQLTVKGVAYFMSSFHPYTLGNNPAIFGSGTYRATMPEVLAIYKFSDKVAGEFRYEQMKPGSFYTNSAKAQYFRFEINYSWKKEAGL